MSQVEIEANWKNIFCCIFKYFTNKKASCPHDHPNSTDFPALTGYSSIRRCGSRPAKIALGVDLPVTLQPALLFLCHLKVDVAHLVAAFKCDKVRYS